MTDLPMHLQPILDFAANVGFTLAGLFASFVIYASVRTFMKVR